MAIGCRTEVDAEVLVLLGMVIFKPSISSNSSIEGKLLLKSVRLRREDMRGEDDVEDVGEGGPKLDTGISV